MTCHYPHEPSSRRRLVGVVSGWEDRERQDGAALLLLLGTAAS